MINGRLCDFAGYLNNDVATKMAINKDGWLRSGDIVCFDEDGYLYVSDRLKEILKYNGYQAWLSYFTTNHNLMI